MSSIGDTRFLLIHTKIERAEHHLREFERERDIFLGTNPYKAVPKHNIQSQMLEYHLIDFRPVPPILSLIVGDVIHNLRSAWDHLVYQLACANGITDPEKLAIVGFPISDTRERFEDLFGRKVEPFLGQKAAEGIKLIQSYKGANDEFWALHYLDIVDKHREILAGICPVPIFGLRVKSEHIDVAPGFEVGPNRTLTVWFTDMIDTIGNIGSQQGDVILRLRGGLEFNKYVELSF